jgi:hypothetical protein
MLACFEPAEKLRASLSLFTSHFSRPPYSRPFAVVLSLLVSAFIRGCDFLHLSLGLRSTSPLAMSDKTRLYQALR